MLKISANCRSSCEAILYIDGVPDFWQVFSSFQSRAVKKRVLCANYHLNCSRPQFLANQLSDETGHLITSNWAVPKNPRSKLGDLCQSFHLKIESDLIELVWLFWWTNYCFNVKLFKLLRNLETLELKLKWIL